MSRSPKLVMGEIVVGVILIMGGIVAPHGHCDPVAAAPAEYDELLEREVEMFSCKVTLKGSSSERLRRYGELCDRKVSFVVLNWERLASEMSTQNVKTTSYAVRRYLNERFMQEMSAVGSRYKN
jgi:hypothetical protein